MNSEKSGRAQICNTPKKLSTLPDHEAVLPRHHVCKSGMFCFSAGATFEYCAVRAGKMPSKLLAELFFVRTMITHKDPVIITDHKNTSLPASLSVEDL